MKRTCNGCKALANDICEFGYTVERVTAPSSVHSWSSYYIRPFQECPKPKTNKEYLAVRKCIKAVSFVHKWGGMHG